MDNHAAQASSEGKSSLAFRTISEVSVEIDVPQHVLRFWESRFSQVRPMKRGGGRRYYRPEDIELLRQIKTYLYKHGYTIKGVQRLLKEHRASELPSLSAYRMQMGQEIASDMPGARPADLSPLEADLAADDMAQEIPPDDFEQTFEVSLAEVTTPEEEPPVPENQMQSSLAAITRIHEELEVPREPIRVSSTAELIQAAMEAEMAAEAAAASQVETQQVDQPLVHIASKETGFMSAPPEMVAAPQASAPVAQVVEVRVEVMPADVKTELGEILAELQGLRAMLNDVAA